MAIIDAILKLRPTAQTSVAIKEALDRAVAADRNEQLELTRLEQRRNDLLLVGSATELTRAEAALASARESAGRVAVMQQQLEQQLQAVVEAEAVAELESYRKAYEAGSAANAKWWASIRRQLEETLATGLEHQSRTSDAHGMWTMKANQLRETHPHLTPAQPKIHQDDPQNWLYELARGAQSADFSGLAEHPRKPDPARGFYG